MIVIYKAAGSYNRSLLLIFPSFLCQKLKNLQQEVIHLRWNWTPKILLPCSIPSMVPVPSVAQIIKIRCARFVRLNQHTLGDYTDDFFIESPAFPHFSSLYQFFCPEQWFSLAKPRFSAMLFTVSLSNLRLPRRFAPRNDRRRFLCIIKTLSPADSCPGRIGLLPILRLTARKRSAT